MYVFAPGDTVSTNTVIEEGSVAARVEIERRVQVLQTRTASLQ